MRNSATLLTSHTSPTEKKPLAAAERSGTAPRYVPIRKGALTSIIRTAMLDKRPIIWVVLLYFSQLVFLFSLIVFSSSQTISTTTAAAIPTSMLTATEKFSTQANFFFEERNIKKAITAADTATTIRGVRLPLKVKSP